jgi:chromosome segregation ATPase
MRCVVRATLLRSDADTSPQEELSQTRARIEELEAANAALAKQDADRAAELAQLAEENEAQSKELSGLRNRSTLSNATWEREREELVKREAEAREEFDSAKQAMQDWEILAMEERSIRENLAERAAELEEQASTHREARERLEAERETQGATVDGLQRALQELQEGEFQTAGN